MSPAAAFHAQLASIMEVLANTAVAEICELVDSGYSVMQLEISRSRKENEVLRRKLRLMELRNARASALRAAATASGTALLLHNGRARAHSSAHHPGNEPRRSGTSGGDNGDMVQSISNQETAQCGDTDPASDRGQDTSQRAPASGESINMSPVVIKVEDDDEPWDQSGQNSDPVDDVQIIEDEAPPPSSPTKQEVTEVVSEEVSSTSVSVQNSSQMSEPSSYDCLMFEPQLQHMSTHNPLQEDPSCSYSLNTGESVPAGSDSGGSFPFSMGDLGPPVVEQRGLPSGQQRALQLPVRRDSRLNAYVRRERWNRALNHSADDGTGKTFACNFCGKTLACLKNLKTHMRVHTGEKPFVCALCGKCFSDSSNLKRHQSVHTGEKRYGCVHCGKRFAQSGSLKVHMSVHTDCKQFKCLHCGKTFISSSHLRRHMTTHAGEKRLMPTFQ